MKDATTAEMERALQEAEQRCDLNHASMLALLNKLKTWDRYCGARKQAGPFYERVLVLAEKTLGPDRPEVAALLTRHGIICNSMGRIAQAVHDFSRALAIREKTCGPKHPEVLTLLAGLAFNYLLVRHAVPAEAESFYTHALAGAEKFLDTEPRRVAAILSHAANFYKNTGREKEADEIQKKADALRAAAPAGCVLQRKAS